MILLCEKRKHFHLKKWTCNSEHIIETEKKWLPQTCWDITHFASHVVDSEG